MGVDISNCLMKSVEEVNTELDRLQLCYLYEEELDQRIAEYEAKIAKLQMKIDDPNTSDDKRELLLSKLQNRTFAYYTMVEYRKGL